MESEIINSEFLIESNNESLIFTPKSSYLNLLIFLTGFGDTASNYAKVMDKIGLIKTKIIVYGPNPIPITGFKGNINKSWYDFSFNDNKNEVINQNDVNKQSLKFKRIIQNELKRSVDLNVYISGFSQGGCIALHIGLTLEIPIKGIICFSGSLFEFTEQNNSQELKILVCHGIHDELIDESVVWDSIKRLDGIYKLTKKRYNAHHTIPPEGFDDLRCLIEG